MRTIELLDLKKEYTLLRKKLLPQLEEVMSNGRFILGKELSKFERLFSLYCGVKHTVGVANGTSALFLALKVLEIGPGDEVITTSMTFNSTGQAIVYTGAVPVFTDVTENTLSVDPTEIEKRITKRTKAIIPVHLYGIPANMTKIMLLAKKYNLKVVEDCAQAVGSIYNGRKMGGFGDLGTYSFMPAKNLGSYGDAGAIVTDNSDYVNKLRRLRNHGRETKYVHEELGYGERMDNLQAAVLLVKINYLDRWNTRRRKIAEIYDKNLTNKVTLIKAEKGSVSNYYTYMIKYAQRDELKKKLLKLGIQTGIYYPLPLHLQPVFSNLGYKKGDLPVVEKAAKEILSLPVHPFLSDRDVDYIIKSVNSNV